MREDYYLLLGNCWTASAENKYYAEPIRVSGSGIIQHDEIGWVCGDRGE